MKGYKFTNKSPEPEFITRCLIRDKKSLLEVSQLIKKRTLDGLKRENKYHCSSSKIQFSNSATYCVQKLLFIYDSNAYMYNI